MKSPPLPINVVNTPPTKTCLLLGPGGFSGVSQLGTLKVIEDYGIPVDEVIGVSVGAINGASFASHNRSSRKAQSVWLSLKRPSQVFDYQNALYFIWKLGMPESIYRLEPLLKLISRLDFDKLMDNKTTKFTAVATQIPLGKAAYFSNKDDGMDAFKMFCAVAASCAFPGGFTSIPIRHRGQWHEYVDGAFKRLFPILKAIQNGCNTIIAVRCRSDKIRREYPSDWIHAIAYGLELKHNLEEKDEIRLIRNTAENINLFVVEPEYLPPTMTTVSFVKGDFQRAIHDNETISLRILTPLIEYYAKQKIV